MVTKVFKLQRIEEMKAIILFLAIVVQCLAIPLKISSPKACSKCIDLIDELFVLNEKTIDEVADRKIEVRFNFIIRIIMT